MTTLIQLIDSVKDHLREPDEVACTIEQVKLFINDGVLEARNSGWLLPLEDDESIAFVANTYEYDVPATFAYVYKLLVENNTTTPSTWNEEIGQHLWEIRVDSGVPTFFFNRGFVLPIGRALKVVGQKRPTIFTAFSDEIPIGMESFLRARALAYSLGYVTATVQDPLRLNMYSQHRRDAELLLARHPREFRVRVSSTYVEGR